MWNMFIHNRPKHIVLSQRIQWLFRFVVFFFSLFSGRFLRRAHFSLPFCLFIVKSTAKKKSIVWWKHEREKFCFCLNKQAAKLIFNHFSIQYLRQIQLSNAFYMRVPAYIILYVGKQLWLKTNETCSWMGCDVFRFQQPRACAQPVFFFCACDFCVEMIFRLIELQQMAEWTELAKLRSIEKSNQNKIQSRLFLHWIWKWLLNLKMFIKFENG